MCVKSEEKKRREKREREGDQVGGPLALLDDI
jgi:hypothetical protein